MSSLDLLIARPLLYLCRYLASINEAAAPTVLCVDVVTGLPGMEVGAPGWCDDGVGPHQHVNVCSRGRGVSAVVSTPSAHRFKSPK